MLYRPVREKTPERLLQIAKDTIANTGYNEISLMSLSSADYSKLPELVDMLMEEFKDKQVSVSLPSLRIDSFSIDIAKKVQQVRKSGLTFAPERVHSACAMLSTKALAKKTYWQRVQMPLNLGGIQLNCTS